MKNFSRLFVWVLLCGLILSPSAKAQTALPFVATMQTSARDWRGEVPELQRAADETATKLLAGGNLYIAATQPSFQAEAMGRSGGLMLPKGYSPQAALNERDTIVGALDGGTDAAQVKALLQHARESHATVILFAGPSRGVLASTRTLRIFPRHRFFDVPYATSPGVETVNNVIGMWSFTAALVKACVERGKMPTMYISGAMPGGDRNAQFQSTPFHTATQVTPDSVRGLPDRYLNSLEAAFSAMRKTQPDAFARGADLLRETTTSGHRVLVSYIGHMFPAELQGARRPAWQVSNKLQLDSTIPPELAAGDTMIFLDYQAFPWELASALKAKGIKLVVTSSLPPLDKWARDETLIYIKPFWEIQDAAVSLPGYDVSILPISGIMQSTVYWQLAQLSTK